MEDFKVVASKLVVNSLNPKNQKVLFAIKASIVDGLPSSDKHYVVNFPAGSPFLLGKEYAVTYRLKDIKIVCDYLSGLLEDMKNTAESSDLLII